MKDVNSINRILREKNIGSFFERITFLHLLFIWIFIIISFGLIYYVFQNDNSFLFYVSQNSVVDKVKDSIYFSFVTATTTGFGDIIPFGAFKVVAIFEVIFGLLLLSIVISKLVSIKQDAILKELYESSINERISKIRSSLLLFRQHVDRIITRIEEGIITKRELSYIHFYISSFSDVLKETFNLITKKDDNEFTISIDPINAEVMFNSILNSFERLDELINILNKHKINWKVDVTLNAIDKCLKINDDLFKELNLSKDMTKDTINSLNTQKSEIISKIKENIKEKD